MTLQSSLPRPSKDSAFFWTPAPGPGPYNNDGSVLINGSDKMIVVVVVTMMGSGDHNDGGGSDDHDDGVDDNGCP